MSLQAEPIFDVPELTDEIARAAFPKGNVYIQMRDELGVFYEVTSSPTCFPYRATDHRRLAVSPGDRDAICREFNGSPGSGGSASMNRLEVRAQFGDAGPRLSLFSLERVSRTLDRRWPGDVIARGHV